MSEVSCLKYLQRPDAFNDELRLVLSSAASALKPIYAMERGQRRQVTSRAANRPGYGDNAGGTSDCGNRRRYVAQSRCIVSLSPHGHLATKPQPPRWPSLLPSSWPRRNASRLWGESRPEPGVGAEQGLQLCRSVSISETGPRFH